MVIKALTGQRPLSTTMASSPGGVMESLDDGQAYKSEADCNQQPSSRVSAVLTCSGNLTDPDFNEKCKTLFSRLQNVLCNGKKFTLFLQQ